MLIQWSERSLRRSLFVDQQGGNKEELGVERGQHQREQYGATLFAYEKSPCGMIDDSLSLVHSLVHPINSGFSHSLFENTTETP